MAARLPLLLSIAALLLTGCVNSEQLRPGIVGEQYVSARDIDEIRALLLSRPDIHKPLWGLTSDDRGRVVAQSGANHNGNSIGSFVTLVHKNGKWQILKIKQGPVMVVNVSLRYHRRSTRGFPANPTERLNQTMKLTITAVRFDFPAD